MALHRWMVLATSTARVPPSPIDGAADAAARAAAEAEATRQEMAQKRRELAELHNRLQRQTAIAKALDNHQRAAPAPAHARSPMASLRQKNKPFPAEMKAQAVKRVLEDGASWREVQDALGMSRSTLAKALHKEKAVRLGEAHEEPPRKRGRPTSFTADALVLLATEVERDPALRLKDLQRLLADRCKVDVNLSTISKTLNKMKLTYKNFLPLPIAWNEPPTIEARMRFVDMITALLIRDKEFIFVDEQGYNLHVRKSKGCALAGRKAVLKQMPKGQRVSVIAALAKSGIVRTRLVESLGNAKRGLNADDFRLFVHDMRPQLRGKVLVLDNARIHHAEQLEALWPELKERDGIDVLFLPPYSPFLNPIEYAFNKMRLAVATAQPDNKPALKDAISAAAASITPGDADAFIRKSKSYWEHCSHGLPFSGTLLDPLTTPPRVDEVFDAEAADDTDDEAD